MTMTVTATATTTASSDRYPAPFPPDLPTIDLQTIPIDDLFASTGEGTSKKLFNILTTEGFFYLDLTTGDRGTTLQQAANELHDAARYYFDEQNVSVPEKEKYLNNMLAGELDQGYRALDKDEKGRPRVAELVVVPINPLLNDPSFRLPIWLHPYQAVYKTFAQSACDVGQTLLHHLEEPLGLEPDTLAAMHRMSPETGGFVRSFRHPAVSSNHAPTQSSKGQAQVISPLHTDANAIPILFNWLGGLQIARPRTSSRAAMITNGLDEEWLYLPPRPACALINLGDPLVVFTNGVLKSGLHRVVRPPGEQARFHRYSVLAGLRPRGDTPMRALESAVIPKGGVGEDGEEVLTAHEWATRKIADLLRKSRGFGKERER